MNVARWPAVAAVLVLVAFTGACCPAWAQPTDTGGFMPTYGNRPIDLLPKSTYAQPEDMRGWDEPLAPLAHELALHLKDLFRIAEGDGTQWLRPTPEGLVLTRRTQPPTPSGGIERLCVVEARRPEGPERPLRLVLRDEAGTELWWASADWAGANQRLRPYWLPVRPGRDLRLVLTDGDRDLAGVPAPVNDAAPAILIEMVQPSGPQAVDAGFALLGADETVAPRDYPLGLRMGIAGGVHGALSLTHHATRADGTLAARGSTSLHLDGLPATVPAPGIALANIGAPEGLIKLAVTRSGEDLARRTFRVHIVSPPSPVQFGARYADLRYTRPVRDGDTERSWDELWPKDDERDVVVSFPEGPGRFVFWRGASYVPCWALPEAWLTYEWLEAEPDFFGAVGCVEPLQDRACEHSSVQILSSTPARVVVRWRYALVDFQVKPIRGEHAEEVFTFYPDGTGTRYLRGFYRDGWHETQELLVVNRPGRRASQALDPQAVLLLSPDGDEQRPVWPKPGFSIRGWPQVIAIVNLGPGPRPFMATPEPPQYAKVWAEPYVDKPDLFNSYPHWPVTRGMRTTWLNDPADFRHPTHSNLVNLVSDPIAESETEKDFLWLIGLTDTAADARDKTRCWLSPGEVRAGLGVRAGRYSRVERAYVLEVEPGARRCTFELLPEAGTPVTDPAFVLEGWTGPADVWVEGAARVAAGQEEGRLVLWAQGRFEEPTRVTVDARR